MAFFSDGIEQLRQPRGIDRTMRTDRQRVQLSRAHAVRELRVIGDRPTQVQARLGLPAGAALDASQRETT